MSTPKPPTIDRTQPRIGTNAVSDTKLADRLRQAFRSVAHMDVTPPDDWPADLVAEVALLELCKEKDEADLVSFRRLLEAALRKDDDSTVRIAALEARLAEADAAIRDAAAAPDKLAVNFALRDYLARYPEPLR